MSEAVQRLTDIPCIFAISFAAFSKKNGQAHGQFSDMGIARVWNNWPRLSRSLLFNHDGDDFPQKFGFGFSGTSGNLPESGVRIFADAHKQTNIQVIRCGISFSIHERLPVSDLRVLSDKCRSKAYPALHKTRFLNFFYLAKTFRAFCRTFIFFAKLSELSSEEHCLLIRVKNPLSRNGTNYGVFVKSLVF